MATIWYTPRILLFCKRGTMTEQMLRDRLKNCANIFALQFSLDREVAFDIHSVETIENAQLALRETNYQLILIDLAPSRWDVIENFLASLDAKMRDKVVGYGDPGRQDISAGWRWPLFFGQNLPETNDILGAILLAGGK